MSSINEADHSLQDRYIVQEVVDGRIAKTILDKEEAYNLYEKIKKVNKNVSIKKEM